MIQIDYYKTVVLTQHSPKILKAELSDLIKEIEEEWAYSKTTVYLKSLEVFDALLNDLTKGKMSSGKYYWLTSSKRIFSIAKRFLNGKELRELHNKYDSLFSK